MLTDLEAGQHSAGLVTQSVRGCLRFLDELEVEDYRRLARILIDAAQIRNSVRTRLRAVQGVLTMLDRLASLAERCRGFGRASEHVHVERLADAFTAEISEDDARGLAHTLKTLANTRDPMMRVRVADVTTRAVVNALATAASDGPDEEPFDSSDPRIAKARREFSEMLARIEARNEAAGSSEEIR